MVEIVKNIEGIRSRLPMSVELVAVSKTHPVEYIVEAYSCGQRIFGENKVQEMDQKHEALKESCPDIKWHLIGHLQTNKVKYIAPYVTMIEAVETIKLLREINRQAERCGRVIKVLLELHIAEESTKFGLTLDACRELLAAGEWREMSHVQICGLMMMASFVDDQEQIRREMQTAADFFDEVKARYFADDDAFCERSWGMSDDYPIACQTRSTMVRIGTAIFGPRVY